MIRVPSIKLAHINSYLVISQATDRLWMIHSVPTYTEQQNSSKVLMVITLNHSQLHTLVQCTVPLYKFALKIVMQTVQSVCKYSRAHVSRWFVHDTTDERTLTFPHGINSNIFSWQEKEQYDTISCDILWALDYKRYIMSISSQLYARWAQFHFQLKTIDNKWRKVVIVHLLLRVPFPNPIPGKGQYNNYNNEPTNHLIQIWQYTVE